MSLLSLEQMCPMCIEEFYNTKYEYKICITLVMITCPFHREYRHISVCNKNCLVSYLSMYNKKKRVHSFPRLEETYKFLSLCEYHYRITS